MSDLLQLAVEAHGGLQRWNQLKTVTASMSSTGAIWHIKGRPNVLKDIVMELSLPGMDGWTATRMLKTDPRTREIPVVALTGNARADASAAARDAGCDAFIVKPCLPDDMVAAVRRVLALIDERVGTPDRST